MPRLPIVGSDDGTWGTYLNEFLEVSLDNTNGDLGERGKLKSTAVDAAGAVMNSDASTASMSFVVDEDNMASNSATKVPTQQSVKAYVDTGTATITGKSISLTSNTLTGTTAEFNTALTDNDFATLAGTETLTNKTLTSAVLNTGVSGTAIVDEDNMASNSATKIPTQQSTKAYVDNLLHEGTEPGTAGIKNKHLDRWFTAMANAKTTPVNIVTFGDSISGSIFNNNYDNSNDRLSWSAKLANLLNKRLGISTATSGFLYAKGDSAAPSMTETNGSNPASLFTWGLGGWAVELDNTEYVRQESSMDGISIMYIKHSNGGQMRIRDGGASGTILATIDTYAATTEVGHVWDSSALTYASHNIYIENIDAGKVVVVEACYVHSGTLSKGFRVWQSCHGGWWTTFWTLYPNIGINQVARMQPDLIISAGGTNDDTGNIATRNQDLIDALQAAAPDTDIVMWVPYIGATYTTADRELLIGVAETNNLAYIDATVAMGSLVQPPFLFDTIHPNETGRTMIAAHVYQVIGGDPFGTPLYEAVKAQIPTLTKTWKGSNGTLSVDQFFESMALQGTPISGDGFGLYPSYLWSAINGLPGAGLKLGSLYLAKASADELTMGTSTKLILADPTGATHAATKGYIDSGTITMTNKTLTSPVLNTGVSGTAIVDEDDMVSNSATKIPTQQSTKAYVDNKLETPSIEKAFTLTNGGFSAIRTAINDSKNTAYDLVILGDSLPMHTFNAPGWTWQLGDKFARAARHVNPTKEVYYARPYYSSSIGHYKMDYCEGSDNLSVTARGGATLSNGQVAYHTAVCDGWTVGYTAGTGSLVVRDGGAGGTILTTIDTSLVSGSGNLWTSNALTYQSNQIHITSTGSTVLDFVRPYVGNRTSGVRVWTVARTGQTSSQFSATPAYGLNFINKLQPDFVLICTGTNDAGSTPVTTLIADILSNAPSATVYGWVPPVGAAFTQSEADAIRTAYETAGIAKIDMDKMLPDWEKELTRDGVHPYASTTRLMADLVWGVLTGDKEAEKMRSGTDNLVNSLDIAGTYNRDIRLLSARQASEEGFTGKPTIQLNDGATNTVTLSATSTTLNITGSETVSGTLTASANAVINGTITGTAIADEDNMSSNSATKVPTQQSVKAYVDAADALKAPIANPTFTGTVTGTFAGNVTGGLNLSNGANGSLQVVSFYGYPALLLYNNAADANGAIAFFGAPLATLIGYSTTAAIVFGAGGASAIDAGLARTGASEMTFYGASSATKSKVNVANPTSASHAATKAYVDERSHIVAAKVTGEYYSMAGLTTATTLLTMTAAGVMTSHPVFFQAGSYDRISVVTSVAAVSTWRFGVYSSSPTTGLPDGETLILDCGTIDMNSTAGQLTATISLTIPTTGVYWIAALVDSYTATPTVYGWTTTSGTAQAPVLNLPVQMGAATATRHYISRTVTGVGTGSMPATYPASGFAANAPKIGLRAA